MKEIPLSKGFVAVVDDEDYVWLSQYTWCVSTSRRGGTRAVGKIDGKTVYLSRVIMGAAPGQEVDHWDGDKMNCQRYNLRVCTRKQNEQNKGKRSKTQPYKGVTYNPRLYTVRPYQARIRTPDGPVCIGNFHTAVEAALAYDVAALRYHGRFARLNLSIAHANGRTHATEV